MWQKFGQGPPPHSFGENPKEGNFFSGEHPLVYFFCTISLQFSHGFNENLVGEKLKTGCHQVHLVPQVVLNFHLSKYLICQIYICKIFQDVTNSVLRLFNAQFDEQLKYCQFLFFFVRRNYLISEIFVIIFDYFYFVPFLWRMYLISETVVKEEPEEEDKAKQVSPDIHLRNTMDYT